MACHPSGDPEVNAGHIDKQHQGDKELKGHKPKPGERRSTPGKGRPDAEEGVGTEQNQRR